MARTIAEYRQQLAAKNKGVDPYADLTDQQFAARLHQKHYSEMPFDAFAQRVGLQGPMLPSGDTGSFAPAGPASRPRTDPRNNRRLPPQPMTIDGRTQNAMQAALDISGTTAPLPGDPRVAGAIRGQRDDTGEMDDFFKATERTPGVVARSAGPMVRQAGLGVQRAGTDALALGEAAVADQAAQVAAQGDRPQWRGWPSTTEIAQDLAQRQLRGELGRGASERAFQHELSAGRVGRATRRAQAEAAAAVPEDAGPIERAVQSGLTSALVTAPIVTAGALIPGAQVPALVALGGMTGAQRYGELRAEGLSEGEAALSAGYLGTLEGLLERAPLGALAKNSPFMRQLKEFMVQDLVGENVHSVANIIDDYRLGLRDDVTLADIQKSIQETTGATIVGAGAQLSMLGLTKQILDGANALAERREPQIQQPEIPTLTEPVMTVDESIGEDITLEGDGDLLPGEVGVEEVSPDEDITLETDPVQEWVREQQPDAEADAVTYDEPPAADIPPEQPRPWTEDDERVALEALNEKTASEEQLAELEGRGFVGPKGGMLPAGKRRLTEIRRRQVIAQAQQEPHAGIEVRPMEPDSAGKPRWRLIFDENEGEGVIYYSEAAAREDAVAARTARGKPPMVLGQEVEYPQDPTPDQAHAGNYRKPLVRWQEMPIRLENLKDSVREGPRDPETGEPEWRQRMASHYGYIHGTKSTDGEGVDVMIGEDAQSTRAWVIDQLTPDGQRYDEPKVVVGVPDEAAARALYLSNYPKGWKGLGAITEISDPDALADWAYGENAAQPLAWKPEEPKPAKKPAAKAAALTVEHSAAIRSGLSSVDADDRDLWAMALESKLNKKGALTWQDVPQEMSDAMDTVAFANLKAALAINPQAAIALVRGQQAAASKPAPTPKKAAPKKAEPERDPRLDQRADQLRYMGSRAGWEEVGGQAITVGDQVKAEVVGRTKWLPREVWFPDVQRAAPLPRNKGGLATAEAVRKAIEGEKMSAAEQRHVTAMLDRIDADEREILRLAQEGMIEDMSAEELSALEQKILRTYSREVEGDEEPMFSRTDIRSGDLFSGEIPEAPKPKPAAPKAQQTDLFGAPSEVQQLLAKVRAEKERRLGTGQRSPETGRPDDLFSQATKQVDVEDVSRTPKATGPAVETVKPGEKGTERQRTDKRIKKYLQAKRPGENDTQRIISYRTEASAGLYKARQANADPDIRAFLGDEVIWAVQRLTELDPSIDWETLKRKKPRWWEELGLVYGATVTVKYPTGKLNPGVEYFVAGPDSKGMVRVERPDGGDSYLAEQSARGMIERGELHVRDPGESAERDSEDADPAASVEPPPLLPEPAAEAGSAGSPGRLAGEKRGTAEGGPAIPRDRPASSGERGNLSFFDDEGRFADPGAATRSDDAGRGVETRGEPVTDDGRGEAEAVEAAEAARPRLDHTAKLRAQRQAESIPVKLTDAENIAATLPYLLPSQHEDVAFAERRFQKPDGYGVLFTNGTGTGKTYLGLGVAKRFAKQGKGNGLIVVPSQKLAEDWTRAGKNLGLDLYTLSSTQDSGRGISITTYANFAANRHLADRNYDFVLVDEAHNLMQNEDADLTAALYALRAITNHPAGAYDRAAMIHRLKYDRWQESQAALAKQEKEVRKFERVGDNVAANEARLALPALEAKANAAQAAWSEVLAQTREQVQAAQGAGRTRAMFLSATPFAYEKNVKWGEGYLFEFPEPPDRGYNTPDGFGAFMMQHFGYRMRTGKLTEPPPEVNRDLMQRTFNSHLRKEGVLSARTLEVDADYDRKFVYVESKIGNKIDEGLTWLRENKRMWPVWDIINKRFDYLARQRLLQALKAQEAVEYIQAQHALGRKVVVFYDYNEGGAISVFDIDPQAYGDATAVIDNQAVPVKQLIEEFREARPDLVELDTTAPNPLTTLKNAFPQAREYNGRIPTRQRTQFVDAFNNDDLPDSNLILAQKAANAGWSAHDTSGKHQRVLINLGLPTAPTVAIQQEGRIFRVGNVSDAVFRYFNTGTSWERTAFAGTIARRAATAENLAMGEQARGLKDAFIQAFEDADIDVPRPGDGKGGKASDRALVQALSEFDRAVALYYAQEKKTSSRRSREGKDYYATPEPLGYMMAQWGRGKPGDSFLEPSAGHGAIARWFPEQSKRHVIEPSFELASRLALATDASLHQTRFEDWNVVNKVDVVVMNPPFGHGGSTAVDHIEKAVKHLNDGGRIVALIPEGQAANKKFENWYEDQQGMHLVRDIGLPPVVFERAGTLVKTRIVILDKMTEKARQAGATIDDTKGRIELSGETIKELFDRIRDMEAPQRVKLPDAQVLEERIASEVKVEPVAAAAGDVPASGGEIMRARQFAHTKTGAAMYIAELTQRVDTAVFNRYMAAARKAGGYYNRYVVPGFAFKTAEIRDAFVAAINGKSAQLRLAAAPGGTPATAVRAEVDRFLGKFKTRPNVVVVQSFAELSDDVQAAVRRAGSPGIETKVDAFHLSGTIYFVADKIPSLDIVPEKILHEFVAHYGLRSMIPDANVRNELLDAVAQAMPMPTRRYGRAYYGKKFDWKNDVQRRRSAEEVIAYYGEKYLKGDSVPAKLKRLLDRIIKALRDFMRDALGLGPRFDERFVRVLLQDLQRHLMRGGDQITPSPAAASMTGFARWFGNSKVVDGNGQPLVVYHGTTGSFGQFDPASAGANTRHPTSRLGFWFTESPGVAELFTQTVDDSTWPPKMMNRPGANVMPVFLSIKNPYSLTVEQFREINARPYGEEFEQEQPEAAKRVRDWIDKNRASLISKGYDGIRVQGDPKYADIFGGQEYEATAWVAFDPSQIKSAIGNSGEFDPDNPDITASAQAPTFYSALLRAAETVGIAKAPAQQWLNTLRNVPGVKGEEIEWVGLEEWLTSLGRPATKAEVVDFIAANQIEVEDTIKGGDVATSEADRIKVELTALGYTASDLGGVVSLVDRDGHEWRQNFAEGRWFVYATREGLSQQEAEQAEARSLPQPIVDLADRLQEIVEEHLQDESFEEEDDTRYSQYTLPGGKNYRELLLTLPTKFELPDGYFVEQQENGRWGVFGPGPLERNRYGSGETREDAIRSFVGHGHTGAYRSSHWSEPNIVAHVRFNERTDADGKRVLFVEEIQSDWHQAGRKRGYEESAAARRERERKLAAAKEREAKADAAHKAAIARYKEREAPETSDPAFWDKMTEHRQWMESVSNEVNAAFTELMAARRGVMEANPLRVGIGNVPDAPFKTTWPELAFKRVIRWAAENGFDRIAWTTGQQQADRYSLEQHISRLVLDDNISGGVGRPEMEGEFTRGHLRAYSHGGGGGQGINEMVDRDRLVELVGEDVAERLIAAPVREAREAGLGVRRRQLEGMDLRMGGEGMRGFYDQMLPKTVNKMVKKWGAKVGSTALSRAEAGISGVDAMDFAGIPRQQQDAWWREHPLERDELIAKLRSTPIKVHSIDITPQMRDAAMEGLPMFSRTDVMERRIPKNTSEARGYAAIANRIIDAWNRKIGHKYGALGNLPEAKKYLIERYKTLGGLTQVREISRGIFESLSAASEQDSQRVYDYLTTRDASADDIEDEKVRTAAIDVKQMIDQQGQALVDAGLLSEESYETYRDQYLPRLYLRHILDDKSRGRMAGSGKKLSDMGYLKQRKDIPEEVRQVILGEITDPAFLAAFGMSRTMRDLALMNFLQTISQNQAWTPQKMLIEWDGRKVSPFWLQAEAKQLRRQADHIKNVLIAGKARAIADRMDQLANKALEAMEGESLDDFKQIPDSPRYGALRGLYVRREIHEDLVGAYNYVESDSLLESIFGQGGYLTKATQAWKTSKVAMNVPSHFRNMMGNAMMLHLSGMPMARVPDQLVRAIHSVATQDEWYQIAKKYGLKEATFANTELYRIRDEWTLLQKSKQPTANLLHAMFSKVVDTVGDVYQFEEALFKIAKLRDAMEREGLAEADAMIEAHKWIFDYSLVPRWVRYTRNAPFGIPFLSYSYFALPRLAETAVRRPWKFLPYIGVAYAIQQAIMSMFGADDDDLEKLRNAFPAWMRSRGGMLLLPWKDQNGRWQVVDLGYTVPWGQLLDTSAQIQEGNFRQSAETMGILSGPLPDLISAWQTGIDPFTGREIADKGDPAWKRAQGMLLYAYGIAAPGFLTEKGALGKVIEAHTGHVDPRTGDPTLTKTQAWLRLFGVSVYPVDPEVTRGRNLRFMQFEIDETRKRMGEQLRDRNLSEQEKQEVRKVYIEEIKRRQEALRKYQEESEIPPNLKRTTTDNLTGRLGPMIQGKRKGEVVRVLRDAGYPALAALFEEMPAKPKASVLEALA